MRPRRALLAPAALAVLATSLLAQNPAASANWQKAERFDSGRNLTLTEFTLTGRFTSPPRGNAPGPPSIVLDCLPHKHGDEGKFLSGWVQVNSPLRIRFVEPTEIRNNSYNQEVFVTWHVASEKPRNAQWPPRSDKTSATLDKETVKKLLGDHQLGISMEEPFESEIVMQFDVPDSVDVLNACGIREHK